MTCDDDPPVDRKVRGPRMGTSLTQPQKKGGRVSITLLAKAEERVIVSAKGQVEAKLKKSGGNSGAAVGTFKLRTIRKSAAAGQRQALRMKLGRAASRRVFGLLGSRYDVRAKVWVSFVDAAGNRATIKRVVRLTRASEAAASEQEAESSLVAGF